MVIGHKTNAIVRLSAHQIKRKARNTALKDAGGQNAFKVQVRTPPRDGTAELSGAHEDGIQGKAKEGN